MLARAFRCAHISCTSSSLGLPSQCIPKGQSWSEHTASHSHPTGPNHTLETSGEETLPCHVIPSLPEIRAANLSTSCEYSQGDLTGRLPPGPIRCLLEVNFRLNSHVSGMRGQDLISSFPILHFVLFSSDFLPMKSVRFSNRNTRRKGFWFRFFLLVREDPDFVSQQKKNRETKRNVSRRPQQARREAA